MAYSWQEEYYQTGATDITVDIQYLDKSYINIYLNGVLTTAYQWISDSVLRLTTALAATTLVTVVRKTNSEYLYIKFGDGAAFIRENLDTQNTQFIHLAQEIVEGRSIDGFYGSISMNGYRITNLGNPIDEKDAVNKKYVDDYNEGQDARIAGLENVFKPGLTTTAYPFLYNVKTPTDTISPPFTFDKAEVYLDGVHQEPGYSVQVVDNTLLFAEVLPAGTRVYAVLGENILPEDGYVSAAQFQILADRVTAVSSDVQAALEEMAETATRLDTSVAAVDARVDATNTQVAAQGTSISNLAARVTPVTLGGTGGTTAATGRSGLGAAASGANSDITSLTGLTTPLSIAQGGSGNTAGRATSAVKLDTPRGFRTNLASTAAVNFDGSADATPGVSGTLPIANGGTGSTTAATALASLGGFPKAGTVAVGEAGTGNVGEIIEAKATTATAVTTAVAKNAVSIVLTPGDWELVGLILLQSSGAPMGAVAAGLNTVSATLPGFPDSFQSDFAGVTATLQIPVPSKRINVAASTTVYLATIAYFNSGTVTSQGYIRARRIR